LQILGKYFVKTAFPKAGMQPHTTKNCLIFNLNGPFEMMEFEFTIASKTSFDDQKLSSP